MKTDLSKILSVSGQHGLYQYVAQARNGAIAESLSDKKKTVLDIRTRITSLADVSIFTDDGEMKLKDVFHAMKTVLEDKLAPVGKDAEKQLKDLFGKAVPNYDRDRFYASHMKKVADWYNDLVQNASLDFVEEDESEPEQTDEQN